jgi:hypothetical protein
MWALRSTVLPVTLRYKCATTLDFGDSGDDDGLS